MLPVIQCSTWSHIHTHTHQYMSTYSHPHIHTCAHTHTHMHVYYIIKYRQRLGQLLKRLKNRNYPFYFSSSSDIFGDKGDIWRHNSSSHPFSFEFKDSSDSSEQTSHMSQEVGKPKEHCFLILSPPMSALLKNFPPLLSMFLSNTEHSEGQELGWVATITWSMVSKV